MTDQDKIAYTIKEIELDYKSLISCCKSVMDNRLDPSIFASILPYIVLYVVEGFDYLNKKEILTNGDDFTQYIGSLKKIRASANKLHMKFKESSYNAINNFNRSEYLKFFKKKYPNEEPYITKDVKNYFISFIGKEPIGNYHLCSKKIYGFDIGSYIDDIGPAVGKYTYDLFGFLMQIVKAIDPEYNVENIKSNDIQLQKVDYADLNMAYPYQNFSIKNNPPILMAFLDVLCVTNSFKLCFSHFCDDNVLGFKILYVVLFNALVSLKDLCQYAIDKNFDIPELFKFNDYINEKNVIYAKNEYRAFCMHYDCSKYDWEENVVFEQFEKWFHKGIKEIFNDFKNTLLELSDRLYDFLIIIDINKKE